MVGAVTVTRAILPDGFPEDDGVHILDDRIHGKWPGNPEVRVISIAVQYRGSTHHRILQEVVMSMKCLPDDTARAIAEPEVRHCSHLRGFRKVPDLMTVQNRSVAELVYRDSTHAERNDNQPAPLIACHSGRAPQFSLRCTRLEFRHARVGVLSETQHLKICLVDMLDAVGSQIEFG